MDPDALIRLLSDRITEDNSVPERGVESTSNFTDTYLNFTASRPDNVTFSSTVSNQGSETSKHLSLTGQIFITVFYLSGISGNFGALATLSKRETARNCKQTLMIRCLVLNDLLALVGSFTLMYMQLYLSPPLVGTRWFCALRVLLRMFGLSSGAVAIVMAVERWLALTRPFLYHKHVTVTRIRRAIVSLWLMVILLVCLPFMGFGLYYDGSYFKKGRPACIRYRFAKTYNHVAYAYLMFVFGMLLCAVIVSCNLAVVRVLCRLGKKCLARRTRKDSRELSLNTPEEVSFAKLMVVLSVFFVTGWAPQMVTILMAQWSTEEFTHPFYRIADICMALNFTLDPVVYVLSRRPHRRGMRRLLKPLCEVCWIMKTPAGSNSTSIKPLTIRTSTQVPGYHYKSNYIGVIGYRQGRTSQSTPESPIGYRKSQQPVPQKYRMKYPPDDGPIPRYMRRYHSESTPTSHPLVDDRTVVSDFVLDARALYITK